MNGDIRQRFRELYLTDATVRAYLTLIARGDISEDEGLTLLIKTLAEEKERYRKQIEKMLREYKYEWGH